MSFRRLGRMLAAASLITASAGILAAAPAGATDTPVSFDCSQSEDYVLGNSDTVTITMSGSTCSYVVFNNPPGGALGTVTVDGNTATPGAQVPISNNSHIVYTAPSSGSGMDGLAFFTQQGSPPAVFVDFVFPPSTGSMVDNGDGSMTLTYSGNLFLMLLAPGSTCPILSNSPPPATGWCASSGTTTGTSRCSRRRR